MIEFSEIQSEEGMYRAIGCRVVQLIEGELEFAAKKGSKGKGGANKKDCKKGLSCGSSCIAKTKACVKEMSASQKAKYNALLKKVKKGGAGGGEAQAEIDKIIADQVAAKTGQQPEPAPVAKAATGTISKSKPLTPAAIRKLEKEAGDFLVDESNPKVASKIARIMAENPSITFAEAKAVATWVGTEKFKVDPDASENPTRYALMNRAKYAPDSLPPDVLKKVEATNALAESAYRKMPPLTEDYIRSVKKDQADFDPDRPLSRFVQLEPDVIQQYKDSIGKEVTEKIHFATTHMDGLDWAETGSNVQFVVKKPRYDGTSKAKYIDHYKNEEVEGEIMFPPGTKFKVNSVTEGNPKRPKPEFNFTTEIESKLLSSSSPQAFSKLQTLSNAQWDVEQSLGKISGLSPEKAQTKWAEILDGYTSEKGTPKYVQQYYQQLKNQPIDQLLKSADEFKLYQESKSQPNTPTIIEIEEA